MSAADTNRDWYAHPGVWLCAAAVAMAALMMLTVVTLIASQGILYFWPAPLSQLQIGPSGGEFVYGRITRRESAPRGDAASGSTSVLVMTGKSYPDDHGFRWIPTEEITRASQPPDLVLVERHSQEDLIGRISAVEEGGTYATEPADARAALSSALNRVEQLRDTFGSLREDEMASISTALRAADRSAEGLQSESRLRRRYEVLERSLAEQYAALNRDTLVVEDAAGRQLEVPVVDIVGVTWPNSMGLGEKVVEFGRRLFRFVSEEPRLGSSRGGVFPAIFGTVLLVLLMSVMVAPLGVIAAIYLHEYARQGWFVKTVRIAVNNLAGVPSIVYGVFGLGLFVYAVGGTIDDLFFADTLPAPTFGTGGLLWASMTLALLTLPVVIVSTEEGLRRIPRAIREGSLALGATQAETLRRVVLPMVSPAILTGIILAIARAAGEVAPLMLVGVVKLAPALPLDSDFPYLHLDRKFMHLGFHIYDVGFQSANTEAAKPLVYATALLLMIIVLGLNLAAIRVRNQLRERYRALESP